MVIMHAQSDITSLFFQTFLSKYQFTGTEIMSWRGKYIGWYRIIEKTLGNLVPNLTDMEVMENVTLDDLLITPTGQESLPRNKKKPIPKIMLHINDNNIELGIIYNNQESLELFRNIFKNVHTQDKEKFFNRLQSLDSNYETLLYFKEQNKNPELLRKYITARLDLQLLERVIDDMLKLRKGGIQVQNNQSVYITPKTPQLYLTRVSVPLIEAKFIEALCEIKPIYETLKAIKTQREIISDRLRKPKIKRNIYREFIESLNEARKQDLISAEKRREFNKKWREEQDKRESLMKQLMELINHKKETQETES